MTSNPRPEIDMSDWLTAAEMGPGEVCQRLGISRTTLHNWETADPPKIRHVRTESFGRAGRPTKIYLRHEIEVIAKQMKYDRADAAKHSDSGLTYRMEELHLDTEIPYFIATAVGVNRRVACMLKDHVNLNTIQTYFPVGCTFKMEARFDVDPLYVAVENLYLQIPLT